MKNRLLLMLLPLALLLGGCVSEEALVTETVTTTTTTWYGPDAAIASVDPAGWTRIDEAVLLDWLAFEVHDPIGLDQLDDLTYLREALRMQRDLADHFWDRYGDFGWFDLGDASHTLSVAVRDVVEHYGFSDPASGLVPGAYADALVQSDYDRLHAQGDGSLADALYAMQESMELMLLDLEDASTRAVDHVPLTSLYRVLLAAVRNHMRALDDWMWRRGLVYDPQWLTQTEYQAIVSGPLEQPVW